MAGPSKGPDRHRREKTPHPTSSLGHPLPDGRGKKPSRAVAPPTPHLPSPGGRGWTAPRAFPSGRGTGEGSLPGPSAPTPVNVKLLLPPRQSRGISQRIREVSYI